MKKFNFLILLFFIYSLFFKTLVFAEFQTEIATITDLKSASEYAKRLIEKYKKEDLEKGIEHIPSQNIIYIYHVGDVMPRSIEWVIAHLSAEGYEVEIKQENSKNFEAILEQEKKMSDNFISFLKVSTPKDLDIKNQNLKESILKIQTTTLEEVKKLFGIPYGISITTRLKRTAEEKLFEIQNATLNSVLAGMTVGFSLYSATKLTHAEVSILQAVIVCSAWVWINVYNNRLVANWFNQGKSIMLTSPKNFEIVQNPWLVRFGIFLRSMIGNTLFLWAAFGFDHAFSLPGLGISATNSLTSLFSSFWFEEWISSKQGMIKSNGDVLVTKNSWSTKKVGTARTIFYTLNSFAKFANLLHVPYVSWVFPASGFYGVLRMIWNNRYESVRKIKRLTLWLTQQTYKFTQCQTLLIRRKVS